MARIKKIFKIGILFVLPISLITLGTYLNLDTNYENHNNNTLAIIEKVTGTCQCTMNGLIYGKNCTDCDDAMQDLQNKCKGNLDTITYKCHYMNDTVYRESTESAQKACATGILNGTYNIEYWANCDKGATYVITINRDGGSLGISDFTRSYDDNIQNYIYTKQTTDQSITVKFPTTGTKTGYSFGGITTEANCQGKIQGVYVPITLAEKTKTFYACWYKDVTFNGNGGKLSVTSKKCDGNSCTIEFPTIKESKTDSEFIGWSLDSTCYEKNILMAPTPRDVEIAQGITIYACWKPKTDTKPPVTPPKDIPPQQPTTTQINDYRWVKSASSSVSCGDYVHITTCKLINNKPSECDVDSINLVKLSNPLKLEYKYIAEANTNQPTCPTNKRFAAKGGATYYTKYDDSTKKFVGDSKTLPCNTEVTFSLPIVYSCIYGDTVSNTVNLSGLTAKQYCRGSYINNGVTEYIYVDRSKLTYSDQSAVCKVEPTKQETEKPAPGSTTTEPIPEITNQCTYNYQPKTNQTTTEVVSLPICYQYQNGKFTADTYSEKTVFTCAQGYRRTFFEDNDNALSTCKNLKKSSEKQICYKVFNYYCSSTARPIVQGSGSLATPEGVGIVKIKGNDSDTNTGLKGYIISHGDEKQVTRFSYWESFENDAYEASVPKEVGTYFAWVMTNDYAVSYSIMLKVHSEDLTTTAQNVELKNPDNNEKFDFSPIKGNDGSLSYTQEINTSKYVRITTKPAIKYRYKKSIRVNMSDYLIN